MLRKPCALTRTKLSGQDGKPFVCPDGRLPCGLLLGPWIEAQRRPARSCSARQCVYTSLHSCDPRSTCNSLKLLATRKDTGAWDGKAKKEMQAIWENGLQVEYVKFENYLSYMLYCAEASVALS